MIQLGFRQGGTAGYGLRRMLLDQTGTVRMQWQLINAWPTKISSTDLKSDGNEVAIDTLEIAYENLVVTNV